MTGAQPILPLPENPNVCQFGPNWQGYRHAHALFANISQDMGQIRFRNTLRQHAILGPKGYADTFGPFLPHC